MSTFRARREHFFFVVSTRDLFHIFLWRYSMVDPQELEVDRHLPIPHIYDDLYSFLHSPLPASHILVFTQKKSSLAVRLVGAAMACCPGDVSTRWTGQVPTAWTQRMAPRRNRVSLPPSAPDGILIPGDCRSGRWYSCGDIAAATLCTSCWRRRLRQGGSGCGE